MGSGVQSWTQNSPSNSTSGGVGVLLQMAASKTTDITKLQIYNADCIDNLPTAAFTMDLDTGDAPHTVNFTDTSNGNGHTITSWTWDFDDGDTSSSQDPVHIFTTTPELMMSS